MTNTEAFPSSGDRAGSNPGSASRSVPPLTDTSSNGPPSISIARATSYANDRSPTSPGGSGLSPTTRRGPARPSPLSRLHSSPGPASMNTMRAGNHTYNQRQAGQMMDSASPSSPCFVHSHLQKYSELDDRVRQKIAVDHQQQVHGQGGHQQHQGYQQQQYGRQMPYSGSGSGSRQETSPTSRNGVTSMFGYNSDGPTPRLSTPSEYQENTSNTTHTSDHRQKICAPSASDLDDAEDGGSLTRQLAETATGVREMSKQLGRTKVKSNIQSVLIVTKARDNRLIKLTREVAVYLMKMRRTANGDRGMIVYVDAQLRTSKRFDAAGLKESNPEFFKPQYRRRSSSTASMSTLSGFVSDASGYGSRSSGRRPNGAGEEGQLRYWTSEMCSSQPHLFDMVVTLGGDGTVLFTSWLFQRIVPPVLPFALGSLGFLTNFDFADYAKTLDKAVDDGIRVNLRMRFTCTVYRAVTPEQAAVATCKKRKAIKSTGGDILLNQVDAEGWEALEGTRPEDDDKKSKAKRKKDKEIMCFSTRPVETFEVLNDLVVDRGPSPYVSLLELFGDDHHLTTVQADGLCVATPTGSTAYSLSAGGSLVHPGIPALLISPICPHTLSFRPMLLPDGMELRVCVPYNSRSTAWASFDGRGRVELKQGDHIKIAASKYPFPTICRDKQSTDWFNSISRTLRWNEREKQKSFVVVEEDRAKPVKEKTKKRVPKEDKLGPDMGGNENITSEASRQADGPNAVESGRDDKARIEASKKMADMGQERISNMTDKISREQEDMRGQADKGNDDDEEDEDESGDDEDDEEEEEEGFDIDDVSEEPPASSPSDESDKTPAEEPGPEPAPAAAPARPAPPTSPYSTKRPSHLLTSLLSMTSQAGDGGYDDPGMKSGVETPDRFGAPYDPTRPSAKSPEAFTKKLDEGLDAVLHDKQKRDHQHQPHHPPHRRTVTNDSSTSEDAGSDLTEKTRAMENEREDELGQGFNSLSLHPGRHDRLDPANSMTASQRRARSRSRSRSRSVSRSILSSLPRDGSTSSTRRLKSTSRSRTRSERTVGAQTETPNESEKDTEREDNGGPRDTDAGRPGRPSRTTSSASTITIGASTSGGHGQGQGGERERRPSVDRLRTPRPSDYASIHGGTGNNQTPGTGGSRTGGLENETVLEEEDEDEDDEGPKIKAFAFYGEDESESGQSDGESEA